ncbi:MAG: DUF2141 domain-containing protein [Bacteroidota bacterium]
MKKILSLFVIVLFAFSVSAQPEKQETKSETGTLLVLVRGFKSTEGSLRVALFNKGETFPDSDAYKTSITEISANEELIKFENLPYGDYAVAVIHDINNDAKLDKNILGIPTEGYGFSNNAMGKYGPPTFLQSSFVFAGRDEARVIDLEYGIPGK